VHRITSSFWINHCRGSREESINISIWRLAFTGLLHFISSFGVRTTRFVRGRN
jgi:hypothetical protein